MKDILAVSAGLLAIVAIIPYVLDIVKRRTKPNIVSWLTWTLLLGIGTAGAFSAHEVRSALLTTGDFIGTGLTLLLGLKFGIAKFSWFDGLCQAGAVAGVILWFIFHSPTIGILAVVIIDFIGSLPTLNHSWYKPNEETWQTFAALMGASTLTLLSLDHFNLASLSYPIYLLLANGSITAVVIYRRRQLDMSLSRTLIDGK